MPASSNAQTKQNDADKDNAEMGTIASSNSQRERERERKLSQCLVAYTATRFFSVSSFPFWMNPLHSLFFTNLLSPHKNLPPLPSQFHSQKQSWFFFLFWGQKLLQSITLSLCSGCSFLLLLLLLLFLSKKISLKLSLLKRNFRLKLSRTLMRVQRLTECYGWNFNNGDLVLRVCNIYIFFNKNRYDLNCQNRSWFTEPGGRTVVRTVPCLFYIEWFLMLNGS